jgi:hypothetical protein
LGEELVEFSNAPIHPIQESAISRRIKKTRIAVEKLKHTLTTFSTAGVSGATDAIR